MQNTFAVAPFSRFVPTKDNPFPELRIFDFITAGPFVLETDGAFETEYFYKRDIILKEDYLADNGGEANATPQVGDAVKNNYFGQPTLYWKKGYRKWGSLRFDKAEEDCDPALYATEQRNCCCYAVTYIDCEKPQEAVICYENSGGLLYMNGVLADYRPYGRCKGLTTVGNAVAVRFRKGRNTLLFKIRTGYICDTVDLSMPMCAVWPAALVNGDSFATVLQPTYVYKDKKQLFQGFVGNLSDKDITAELLFDESALTAECKAKTAECIRPALPAEENTTKEIAVSLCVDGKAAQNQINITVTPAPQGKGTQYRFSDFHFDTTYHQEQRTYAMGAMWITAMMTEKLGSDPDFKAILSEVDYVHPFVSLYPQYRNILLKAFKEGRAEADCFFNQPNELTSSGEAFVRNLLYGQFYHRDVLGRIAYVYNPCDVFGHPNQLSQICLKGGCRAVRWGKFVLGLDNVFRHMSPDGTIALHDKGCGRQDAMRLGLTHFSGGGDAVDGVPAYPTDGTTAWMKDTDEKAHFAVMSEMMDGMLQDVKTAEDNNCRRVDITSRDMTQHHSGVILTRTDFKQANRLAENLLITAEKLAGMAALYGATYPDKALDKAWRQLLCAQHHDSVTGTNNEISFIDLMIEYKEAVDIAAEIVKNSAAFLSSGIRSAVCGESVIVFNPHLFKRKDVCTFTLPEKYRNGCSVLSADGKIIKVCAVGNKQAQFVADVPAFGFHTYTLQQDDFAQSKKDGGLQIENEFFRLMADAALGGGLVSIYDKKNKKEVLRSGSDGPANRIAVLREVPDRMETQHEIYTTGQKLFSSDFPAVVMREQNGVFSRLIVETKLDIIAKVRQIITLYRGIDRIDFKTVVEDYQSRDDLFCVTFPLDVAGAKPVFEDRFAPHVWAQSKDKLRFQTHQYANFSHSKIAPCGQWIEYGPTVLAAFGKAKLNIGMSAVIRNEALYKETDILLEALTKKAIPVTPYPDKKGRDGLKLIHFNEDLDNTDTRFVLSVDGIENEYEQQLLNKAGKAADKWKKSLQKNGCAILYLQDNDNLYGKVIDVFLIKCNTRERLTQVLSDFAEQLQTGNVLTFDAVSTVQPTVAENYGVALFNKGTPACSVEQGGLMSMMLFHTADFYGNKGQVTGAQQLIPEQKTHSFSYALYPHAGDYTQARVFQKAQCYNDGLFCATEFEDNQKVFSQKHSFLAVSDGITVTALKAGGEPLAKMQRTDKDISERGLVLRYFGTAETDKTVSLKTDFALSYAEQTNLLEEDAKPLAIRKNAVKLNAKRHSIETVRLLPEKPLQTIGAASLGREQEPVQPVYVRSWEHDMGSVPLGYLKTCAVIDKKTKELSDTAVQLHVHVTNNRTDSGTQGTLHLTLSDGFTADKTEIPYQLAASEAQEIAITVTKPDKDATGVVYLHYEDEGQQFEDVFEFGLQTPSVRLEFAENELLATVINNTDRDVHGALYLATPFETWPALGFNTECRMQTENDSIAFAVPVGERRTYRFLVTENADGLFNALWAAVKLTCNGRIRFGFAARKGERHNCWAHELQPVLFGQDEGSIERLLKM